MGAQAATLTVALAIGVFVSCNDRVSSVPAPQVPSPSPAPVDASREPLADARGFVVEGDAAAPAGPDAGAHYTGRTDGCPDGMVRVDGEYCPVVLQPCLEKMAEQDPPNVAERCVRYKQPTECLSASRVHMSFCMDRFEYPNREGELPRNLTDFRQASALCETRHERMCTVQEFNFACEGPDMLPYAYGFVRDAAACNIDKTYRSPDLSIMMPYFDQCPQDRHCQDEIARLDQRWRIGEHLSCVSWAGVYDLNGNVNEWVRRLDKLTYPDRGGLKGGWWGPVRDRCRPTHTTHNEDYWGYEVGFRCCKDASADVDSGILAR
jgi:sulfatase modifying factor 1